MSYQKYAGDPREMTARFAGKCSGKNCGARFAKGERIFYYPNGKHTFAYPCGCGDRNQTDFMNHAMAEDFGS